MATAVSDGSGLSLEEMINQLLSVLEHQQWNAYATLSAAVFYSWDTVTTINEEITYIWWSRTSTVKIFYFLNRYFRLFMAIALAIFTMWPHPFTDMCLAYGIGGTLGVGVVGPFLTGVILQIRLYALYNRSTKLIIFVGLLFTGQMVSVSILAGLEVQAMLRVRDKIILPGIPFCFNGTIPAFFAICIPILSFDFIVLVLACYQSIQRYRLFPPTSKAAQNGKHLVAVLFRDSILYFAVNVVVYVANVLMWQYGPRENYTMISAWCNVVTGAAASRMLINTRRAVKVPQRGYTEMIPGMGSYGHQRSLHQ